jgi:hypothetical protein
MVVPVVLFQNCGNVSFKVAEDSFAALDIDTNKNGVTYVETELNTPVDFGLPQPSRPIAVADIRVRSVSSGKVVKGSFVARNLSTLALNYTPKLGFRGRERVMVTAIDRYGIEAQFEVVVVVGNPLRNLEPALAVRGMGCVQCHSSVASNVITDFGFGGDGKGHDYYFGGTLGGLTWQSGNAYGDHGKSFNTLNIPSDKSVIVPKADLPSQVMTDTNLKTLASYIESKLAASPYEGSRSAKVVEKSSVTIAAPTDEQLKAAFQWTAGDRLKFFPEAEDTPELSGLKDLGHVFTNDGVLNCEGDLALEGPLFLDNLHIVSKEGCRLYVLGSVFISGPITFDNSDEDRNLQITASKSINMGLGESFKDGASCDPILFRYGATEADTLGSLRLRYTYLWTTPSQVVRSDFDGRHFGESVLAEAKLVQSEAGRKLWDASCEASGREISFEHVMFNAPAVHNRYVGNVIGTVIAEYALMSLGGRFKFQFDPVFRRVPVLPFLDHKTYLAVED